MVTDADATAEAEMYARVTGSVGATVRHERVEADGSLSVLAEGTWTRESDLGEQIREAAYAGDADTVWDLVGDGDIVDFF